MRYYSQYINFTHIYVLALEEGYYYIGATKERHLDKRLRQHFNRIGAIWTQIHAPVYIAEIIKIKNGESYKETLTTLRYMQKYTSEKVRGARWCRYKLSHMDLYKIDEEIKFQKERGML